MPKLVSALGRSVPFGEGPLFHLIARKPSFPFRPLPAIHRIRSNVGFWADTQHKAILTTNHKPVVRGTDEGIWRRIHLVPFTVVIPERDVEKDFRKRRLIPELAGILNWALEGLSVYRKEGLNPPAVVRAATDDYREARTLSANGSKSDAWKTGQARCRQAIYTMTIRCGQAWDCPRPDSVTPDRPKRNCRSRFPCASLLQFLGSVGDSQLC